MVLDRDIHQRTQQIIAKNQKWDMAGSYAPPASFFSSVLCLNAFVEFHRVPISQFAANVNNAFLIKIINDLYIYGGLKPNMCNK